MNDDERHLRERVADVIAKITAAREDGTITFAEGAQIVGELVAGACHIFEELDDQGDLDKLIAECESLFDEYIQPIDIRGVPNWLEPTVDSVIRRQIRPLVEAVAKSFKEQSSEDE